MCRLTVFCFLVLVPLVAAQDRKDRKPRDEIERLSARLERDARELHEEVISHFRGREKHRELEKHLQAIEKLAARVREVTDRKERPRHVREMLGKIDEEMRHVDRAVLELGREKELDRKAYDRVRDELSDLRRILYRLRKEI